MMAGFTNTCGCLAFVSPELSGARALPYASAASCLFHASAAKLEIGFSALVTCQRLRAGLPLLRHTHVAIHSYSQDRATQLHSMTSRDEVP